MNSIKNNPNNFYYYSPPSFHKIEPIMPQEYNDKIDKKHLTSMSYIEGKPMLNILEDVASANNISINSIYCDVEDGEDSYAPSVLSFYTANITKIKNNSYEKQLVTYNRDLEAFIKAKEEHKELLKKYEV